MLKISQDPDTDPESDPKLSEKSDPDPDTDPKKIIPDPQHCFKMKMLTMKKNLMAAS